MEPTPPRAPRLDPPAGRPPRLTVLLLLCSAAVALAGAASTSTLVRGAVEARMEREVSQTARLLGGGGFPLGDGSLRRVAGWLEADLAVVDAQGHLLAASLEPPARAPFEAALARGELPRPGATVRVERARLGEVGFRVGVAPVPAPPWPGHPTGALYVLYPADSLAAQARQIWLPVALVALLATALATALGVLGERSLRRARTEALLRLLVSVSHELRNPLGAIRGLARSLAGEGQGPDKETLELIAAEAERLGLLVEGLRTVGLPLRTLRGPVAADQETEAVLALLAHQLAHRQVRVELALGAPEARALADPQQLRQVVLNLVQNAAEAMPGGGSLRLRSEVDHEAWSLHVEDEGPGVPAALRPQLFQPFATTRPTGLGLGLYLSRRLAEAHQGSLCLVDSPRGAHFVLRLPLAAPAESATASSRPTEARA